MCVTYAIMVKSWLRLSLRCTSLKQMAVMNSFCASTLIFCTLEPRAAMTVIVLPETATRSNRFQRLRRNDAQPRPSSLIAISVQYTSKNPRYAYAKEFLMVSTI